MRTRKSRWLVAAIMGLVLITLLAACDSNDNDNPLGTREPIIEIEDPDDGNDTAFAVSMVDNAFEPPQITVTPGTTVVWTNNGALPHTVTAGARTSPSGLFDSGQVAPGGTFEYTFTEEGTFSYFCSLHPGMDGTVIVSN